MASLWTEELKAKVTRLWEKHSDSVISRILWEEDRVSFSRNAIIGARHRMGGGASVPRPVKEKKEATRANRAAGPMVQKINNARASASRPTTPKISIEATTLRCVEIVPRHLSLIDLEPGDCRYPYGGDAPGEAITFCGHPAMPDKSWCVPHYHLCRGNGTPSERLATKGIAA